MKYFTKKQFIRMILFRCVVLGVGLYLIVKDPWAGSSIAYVVICWGVTAIAYLAWMLTAPHDLLAWKGPKVYGVPRFFPGYDKINRRLVKAGSWLIVSGILVLALIVCSMPSYR